MSDTTENLLDAAHQAIRMERVDGDMRLLAQRVGSGMENVTNSLASVQAEIRSCHVKISELADVRGSHDSNRAAIDKMERTVTDLRSKLETWFDDFDEKQNQKWLRHEAENEDSRRDIEKEIRAVRERTNHFASFGAAVTLLGGVIVGMFLSSINYRFDELRDDLNRIEALPASNTNLTPRRTNDIANKP